MNHKSFHIIEASCIAVSLVGSVISAVTGQIVYASAPLAIALSMNFINRAKLQQQTTTEVTRLSQSIVSLPQLASTTELSQRISTKAPIEKVEKLEGRLDDIFDSVEKKLTLFGTKLNVLPGLTELDKKILKIQSYLDLIVSDQLSGFDNNVLAVNQKLEFQRQQLENLLEHINSDESRIDKLENNNNVLSVNNKLESQRQQLENLLKRVNSYESVIDKLKYNDNILSVNKKIESQKQELGQLLEHINSYESRIYKLEDNNSEYIYGNILGEVKQINQLLNQIQPSYEYSLVCDRLDSRNYLIEAINESKHRLILVCPWLTNAGFYDSNGSNIDLVKHIEFALERGVTVDIGWGYLSDIPSDYQNTQMSKEEFLNQVISKNNTSAWKYEALEALENLQSKYQSKLNLKLMGTHEKFLTCDRSFGIIGSHNFLTSGSTSKERELGLRTNDPNIIKQLIERFDSARSLSDFSVTNYPEIHYPANTYAFDELDMDDIPF